MTTRPRTAKPVPTPQASWDYSIVTPRPLGSSETGEWFRWNGIELQYLGAPDWSASHHEYRALRPANAPRTDEGSPVPVLVWMAAQLGVSPAEMRVSLQSLTWAEVPDGCCNDCWQQGKTVPGATFAGPGRILTLCLEHAQGRIEDQDWWRI